ncbi:MAG: NERD domain-containing protein [Oscillospiraceae bacterium]|nr:NERD domain-containing protein [Oscillospiraceae bacterium]
MTEEQLRNLIYLCIALFAAALIVVVVTISRRKKMGLVRHNDLSDGYKKQVAGILKRRFSLSGSRIISDFCFKNKGKIYTFDHLLVGEFGLLAVDVLLLRGELYGEEKDDHWTNYRGDKKFLLPNLAAQTEEKVASLRAALGKEGLYGMKIYAVSVVADQKAEIFVPDALAPMKTQQFSRYLSSSEFEKVGSIPVDKLASSLANLATEEIR